MKKSSVARWAFPVIGLCAAVAAGVVANTPAEPAAPRVLISCSNLTAMLLGEVGVTPTSLATVAATNEQVSTIVAGARGMCEGEGGAFGQAHVAHEQAAIAVSRLESKLARGGGSAQERAQLDTQRDQVAVLRSTRDEIVASVEQLVVGTLDAEQRAAWQNIRAAGHVNLPEPFKVIARTDAEWINLRDQLSEERVQAEQGQPVAQPREIELEVQVAQTALEARFASVRTAWRQALE